MLLIDIHIFYNHIILRITRNRQDTIFLTMIYYTLSYDVYLIYEDYLYHFLNL